MFERVHTQTHVVVGAILERGGKFLLVQEKTGDDKGKWNQPAGWLELEEHPLDGVRKEVKEETGLNFEPEALIGVYVLSNEYKRKKHGLAPHALKLIFKGTFTGPIAIDKKEVDDVQWFSESDIKEIHEKGLLRDLDILNEIQDYKAGKSYSLDMIRYTVAK